MSRLGIFLGFAPEGGGAFQYAESVLAAASKLGDAGVSVVAAHAHPAWRARIDALGGDVLPLPANDGPVGAIARLALRMGMPPGLWRRLAPKLHPLVARLLAADCDAWLFPAQDYLAYAMPGRTIGVVHDLMHRHERRFPEVSSWGLYRRRERHYRNTCEHAAALLVDSTLGMHQLVEAYGPPEEKIHVLPYAAPAYMRSPEDAVAANALESLSLPRDFIFYPAQFWQHKNHANLLRALALAREVAPALHLVLAGSPKNMDVMTMARGLGLDGAIRNLGYVPDEWMAGIYRRARALVMPTYFGPTNIPPLEAMTVGCPVAVSGIYAMPEQLGDAALYFDPDSPRDIADAILKVVGDEGIRSALISRGFVRASQRSQDAFDARFREIILGVLDEP